MSYARTLFESAGKINKSTKNPTTKETKTKPTDTCRKQVCRIGGMKRQLDEQNNLKAISSLMH